MNITFLIGNGFDLNCGLKSSYNDMYDGYCEEEKTDSKAIKKFKNLINKNLENWSNFEWTMAEMINEFETENDFIECLTDFEKYLNNYLAKEETNFFEKYQTNEKLIKELQDEIKKSIITFYQDINNNITNNIIKQIEKKQKKKYNFIVFNYTEVFDRMIGLLDAEKDVIYIHGSLKGKDTVLGIDNETQLKPRNFALSDTGRISFIKPIFNNEFDSNRVTKAKEAILESDIICVYGMSLGESDLTWKNLIIQWLYLNLTKENGHLFIYDYNTYLQHKDIFLKREQFIEEVKTKEKYIPKNLKIKNKKYFNKIHMPFKNIFNINEIVNKKEIMLKTAYQKMIDEINKKKIENI